jgi:FAD/FMN-containing dehydrogenase
MIVNDIHSQLNATEVNQIVQPHSLTELQALVSKARVEGVRISVAGARHAMGTQQFGSGTLLVDMSEMNRVIHFDAGRGEIEIEAGIQWPTLIDYTVRTQRERTQQVGIIQKQTGADLLSIGGALASNVHGRGLRLKPIIEDVESFVLIDGEGSERVCNRSENKALFCLAIGGYGLFGIIASVRLRLTERRLLQRVAEIISLDDLIPAFERRTSEGCLYGDFQFMTDEGSEGFIHQGVFTYYIPVSGDTLIADGQKELTATNWKELYYLAHADRRQAWEIYSNYYLSTSGQLYWSDTHQLSFYLEDYHRELDARTGAADRGSEMTTEVFVPRRALTDFMEAVRLDLYQGEAELIYGTIRLIERDSESFLAWAREAWACVVFNLHVTHNQEGIRKAQVNFRCLIDRAIEYGGSYNLTYHRWATREQVAACYPQFIEFLRRKQQHDSAEIFQSDWYRHYKSMFAGSHT